MERKPLLQDRRGMGIGDIYPTMLTIALVAILIALVLIVLDSFADQTATNALSTTNETNAFVNATGYTLSNADDCRFNTPVLTAVWAVEAGNYNVSVPLTNVTVSAAGVVTNATAGTNANASISYTYLAGGEACDSTEEIITQISDFVPWIGIILLIVAAAIVLGILIRNLAGGSRV